MSRPQSTYRLQLRPEFGFDDVVRVVPYLAQLGISHVYLSPHMQAVAGSSHGYDIVDHSRVNDQLGGRAGYERMTAELRDAGIGVLADIVPNHMAIPGRSNAWWWDVLKNGESSSYARYFDIDWPEFSSVNHRQILLPVLGDRYGRVLRRGELKVDGDVVRYFDSEFPLSGDVTDDIHDVLERQHYRLAYWRLASDELEYRRFFDINSLIALRTEREAVFDETHSLVKEWISAGSIDGLRIDHVDGLADPSQYLQRVRAMLGDDGYLVVEKILEPGERLRASWPVQGTTGYDALRLVDGVFVEAANEEAFDRIYRGFAGYELSWEQTARWCKRLVIDGLFGSDIARVVAELQTICDAHAEARDYSQRELRAVVTELLVALDVYRTYVVPETDYVSDADRDEIERAATEAKREVDESLHELVDFTAKVLTLAITGEAEANFVRRFQQTSGPVMAKGIEDTAGYRYNRLVSLNEVGGAPNRFGVRPDEFHEAAIEASKAWPERMIASTTHDTKRSEDFRYRIALLSEIPEEWQRTIHEWRAINVKHRTDEVDNNTEYLIYQTLVGAFPIDVTRLKEYVLKAVREARAHTGWQSPDPGYENAMTRFVEGLMSDAEFGKSLGTFVEPLIELGRINSLSAVVLRMTMPGVPDLFQGSELWNNTLVDPDNRQPVDYDERRSLLDTIDGLPRPPAIDDSGAAKLFVIRKLLALRLDLESYHPLVSVGERAANVVAFCRDDIVVVVPRLVVSLAGDWLDTFVELPEGFWRNVFDDAEWSGPVKLAEVLGMFPVAVLAR